MLNNERELIEAAKAGCIASRNQLVESCMPLLYRVARRRAPLSLIEDVVQEGAISLMVVGFERFDATRVDGSFRGFVGAYFRRFVRSYLSAGYRKNRDLRISLQGSQSDRAEESPLSDPPSGIGTADEVAAAVEELTTQKQRIAAAIQTLPGNWQYVVTRWMNDDTAQNIARFLGLSKGAVVKIIEASLPLLRDALAEESPLSDPPSGNRRPCHAAD